MTDRTNNISFYIYKDLRASQNKNPAGHSVPRFATLEEAIAEFNHLPVEWTTALGIHIDPHSEIDLVQRREGEPVLSGDYQRIPLFNGNPAVQATVRKLCDELHIQWQSDYRVFGHSAVQIPIPSDLDYVRDRSINGKHLVPEDPRHIITSIKEIYTPEHGWIDMDKVYDIAIQHGYDNPHIPKITNLHVRYADERGRNARGDVSPYNYILLQERTLLMDRDKTATKRLAEVIEEYIYRMDPESYNLCFGDKDRYAFTDPAGPLPSYRINKDQNTEKIIDLINQRDLTSITEAVTAIMERGLTVPTERMEARELLGRILNIPEDGEKKLPIDLRMRANQVLDEIYRNGAAMELQTTPLQTPIRDEGR